MARWRHSENLRIGLRSIAVHKLRSALTMLGVIFGVGAVVSMLAIAGGARQEAVEQIRLLGTNNIRIHHQELTGEARDEAEAKGSRGLSHADARLMASNLPASVRLAPVRFVEEPVIGRRGEVAARVVATNADYGRITDFRVAEGRFLSDLDLKDAKRVAVIGEEVRRELFPFRHPIGQRIRVGDGWFTVVGVMESKSLRQGRSTLIQLRNLNRDVYIPITTASGRFASERSDGAIQEIALRVPHEAQVGAVAGIARRLLDDAHRGVEDFEIVVPAQLLAQAQTTQRVFNIVMGSIAAISLLVGGIGIMNVMLTSVTERTREIGIRRAVGATRRAILGQFLMETVLISVGGGVVGILLGFGMAEGINRFAGWETALSLLSTAAAFGIAALVGVVFGLYPARRAANMDPIAALRFE